MAKFENQEDMIKALASVFTNSSRNVHAYVRRIDPVVWSDSRVTDAIKKFIRGYKHAQIEIVQYDSQFAKSSEFFKLAKRLSQIHILTVSDDILRIEPQRNFIYADNSVSLLQPHKDEPIGFVEVNDKAKNQKIQDSFKHIKVMAKPSAEFKTLMV